MYKLIWSFSDTSDTVVISCTWTCPATHQHLRRSQPSTYVTDLQLHTESSDCHSNPTTMLAGLSGVLVEECRWWKWYESASFLRFLYTPIFVSMRLKVAMRCWHFRQFLVQMYTLFYKKLVYKKLDPPRSKIQETERALFKNLRNFLYRKQKLAKSIRI